MQKGPVTGAFFSSSNPSTDFCHIRGLWSFLALNNFEFDLIALGERLESGSTYRTEVHKDIGPSLARYETKSLGVVEPFDRTRNPCHLAIPLSAGQSEAVTIRAEVRKVTVPRRISPCEAFSIRRLWRRASFVQRAVLLRRSSHVMRGSPTAFAPQCHVGVGRRGNLPGITFDRS
jgi:hypothetical protein